ncbi:RHS repeat-associated core domain-containing protein, partial [Candidatus Protochlamydia phocaeensis]|uniref:RHS repeat-associated core domain-containing protein n=1 Tax=Candidatus Protochlamydia phocaeensis TaxID=1414722 RepID=UPI0008397109
RYTAFGEETILNANGQDIAASQVGNPWRYASKRVDPETGWIYFGRRYYDPEIGRWTTPDPLGFADGPNLYAYLHHNPLSAFDAYGLFEEDYQGDPADHPIYDQDLEYFDNNYDPEERAAIRTGIIHGLIDSASDPVFETYSDCFKVGIDSFEELSAEEREQIHKAHTSTVNAQLDYYEKLLQSAPGSSYTNHSSYQLSRSLTKTTLRIGAIAYAGYRIVTSFFTSLKSITSSKRLTEKLPKTAKELNSAINQSSKATDFIWAEIKLGDNKVYRGWVDLRQTIERIKNGLKLSFRNDGSIFKNREGLLPKKDINYYQEFVHPTPGINHAGPQRIIRGANGETYYTPDHYKTFIPIL